MASYQRGQKVTVHTRYEGSGRYAPDGFEGEWVVIKDMGTDLNLARVSPDDDSWVFIHKSRIVGDEAAA